MSFLQRLFGKDFEAIRGRAEALFQDGRWADARAQFEHALDRAGNVKGEVAGAIASRIEECGRQLAAGHLGRAEALEARGDVAGAMEFLDAAVAVAPEGPERAGYLARRERLAAGEAARAVPLAHDATIVLSEPILPVDRGDRYERPLDEMLRARGLGQVAGAGTSLDETSGEIVEVEIRLHLSDLDQAVAAVIHFLAAAGAPKGTRLRVGGREEPCGTFESLALFIDAARNREQPRDWFEPMLQELLDAVAQPCEARHLHSYRDGRLAAYLYAPDAEGVWRDIEPLVRKHPACRGARAVLRHGFAPETVQL